MNYLLQRPFIVYLSPDYHDQFNQALSRFHKAKEAGEMLDPHASELTLRGRRRARIHVQAEWVLADDHPQNPDACCRVAMMDITDRKAAEAAVLRAKKLESLTTLSGGLAHDLNNLLASIKLNADLLLVTKVEHDNEQVQSIQDAVQRAKHLTEQLLTYAGNRYFEPTSLDLNALIKEATPALVHQIPAHIIFRTELTPDLPPIWADRQQIRQLLHNLIANSVEAITSERVGQITLETDMAEISETAVDQWQRTGRLLAPGRYLILSLADNGVGMDLNTRESAFDPFFTTKFLGRGLGLASVMGIAQQHGGAVRIQSQVNQGATFQIAFPLATRQEGQSEAPALKEAEAEEADADASVEHNTVLIIDDEKVMRQAVREVIHFAQKETMVANDGPSGVNTFRKHHHRIGLVILDQTMPGLVGTEIFPQLQQIDSRVPVILTSGYGDINLRQAASELGMAGFLAKPFNVNDLLSLIRIHMA
jgi:signal transduction histidine kinase